MNACSKGQNLERRKRRIKNRLRERRWKAQKKPMLRATNIQYDVADRDRGLAVGGIGAMFQLARHTGLVEAIDEDLHLLKVHLPYHESGSGLAAATGGVLRVSRHRSRRDAGADHGRVQGGHGHLLQGCLGLPPAGGLSGEHRGAVVHG